LAAARVPVSMWRTPAEVDPLVARLAALGYRDIVWQVRDGGFAYYASTREPVIDRLRDGIAEADPLRLAAEAAQRHGVRLHAWLPVLQGARGPEVPRHRQHLWNTQAAWFATPRDTSVHRGLAAVPLTIGPGEFWLNPSAPGLPEHLAGIVEELAGYDIAGVHLSALAWAGPGHGWDHATQARFGGDAYLEQGAWNAWRRQQVTDLLAKLVAVARGRAEGRLVVSACVAADPAEALYRYGQDEAAWTGDALVDVICREGAPMDEAAWRAQNAERHQLVAGAPEAVVISLLDAEAAPESLLRMIVGESRGGVIFAHPLALEEPNSRFAILRGMIAGDAAPVAWPSSPFSFREVQSSSPLLPLLQPWRLGGRVKPPAVEGVRLMVSHAAGEAAPMLVGSQALGAAESGAEAIQVSDELPAARKLEEPVAAQWVAVDEATSKPLATSAVLRRLPVLPNEEWPPRGYFGDPLDGLRDPLLVPADMVWVCVENEDRVAAYNPSGKETPFSPLRAGLDEKGEHLLLRRPRSLCYGANDEVLLLSGDGPRCHVVRFDFDGKPLPSWPLPFAAEAMATDARGRIYLTESTRAVWHLADSKAEKPLGGPFVAEVSMPEVEQVPPQWGLTAIKPTPDGRHVYAVDLTRRRVVLFEGEVLPGPTTSELPTRYTFRGPVGLPIAWGPVALDFSPQGELAVSDAGRHAVRFYGLGDALPHDDLWSDFPALRFPAGVAFFPGGVGAFVAMHGHGETIGQLIIFTRRSAIPPPEPTPEATPEPPSTPRTPEASAP